MLDVFRQGETVGQPVILFQQSNSDPAEDFTFADQGLVSDFFAAGLVSAAATCTTAATLPATAPHDGLPGLLGVRDRVLALRRGQRPVRRRRQHRGAGTKVTLQPCGVSAKTVWIMDYSDAASICSSYVPLINGSTPTSRSRPS